MMDVAGYFEQLATCSRSLLDRLPMEGQFYPLDYVLNDLYEHLNSLKQSELNTIRSLWHNVQQNVCPENVSAGLNTTGMLTDRLTILIIREWHVRHDKLFAKADEIYRTQTRDVIECLARCMPARYIINAKITRNKVNVEPADWEEAYYDLLAVNLIMWKSQETLYIKDIEGLPCEDLRAHIRWFSAGNVKRNMLIEWCEKKYWEKYSEYREFGAYDYKTLL